MKTAIANVLCPFGMASLLCLAAGCRSGQTRSDQRVESDLSAADQRIGASRDHSVQQDDLEWLIGRWYCAARQYLIKVEEPLGSHCEDALDCFNVYFPYADDRLTLDLADNPDKRPIAAEFLVRRIGGFTPSEEKLATMSPQGPVRIGKDRIWVGYPFEDFEFRYLVERRGTSLWLILESKSMRLELYKLPATDAGDIKSSFVHAPIKDYSPELISELKRRYDELRGQNRKRSQVTEPRSDRSRKP